MPALPQVALLAIRDFRIWWLGFIPSTIAISAYGFGVGWLAVELTATRGGAGTAAFYLGMVGLARAAPTFGLGAFAGVVGDRYDRRNILIAAKAVIGVTALALGLLVVTHAVTIAALLALSAVNAAAATFYHAVRQVIQPRLVGEANLLKAMGMNGSVLSTSTLVGPLLGGALVVTIGVGGLLLACGVVSIAVAFSLASINPQNGNQGGSGSTSILRSFVAGLAYVRRTPAVFLLLAMFAAITLLVRPLPFMLPALARDVLDVGPSELSWLVSAAGAGAILSGLVNSLRRRPVSARTPRAALYVAVAAGFSLTALATQKRLLLALLFVALTQFLIMQASSLVMVTLQTTTPDGLRGRVVGIQSLLADGGTECGVFLIGAVGGAAGISTALGASGGALALLCLAVGVPLLTRTQRATAIHTQPEVK